MSKFRFPLCVLLLTTITQFDQANSQEAGVSDNIRLQTELLGAIEGAFAAADANSPYEVVGRSFTTEQFGEDVQEGDQISFRLRFNQEEELVVWAYEHRRAAVESKGKVLKQGKLTVSGKIIDKGRVYSCSGGRVAVTEFQSFDEALVSAVVPHVRYWGVLGFPYWGNPSKELSALKARIGSENATISVKMGNSFVRYTLREDHQPGQFDLRHWDFDQESLLVVRRHIERAAAQGRKVTYQLQKNLLERSADTKVPFLIDRSDTIVQNYRDRKGGRLGTKATVTELGWIRVGKAGKEIDPPTFAFRSSDKILAYIDEGKKLAFKNVEAN